MTENYKENKYKYATTSCKNDSKCQNKMNATIIPNFDNNKNVFRFFKLN